MKTKSVGLIILAVVAVALSNAGIAKAADSDFGSWPSKLIDRIKNLGKDSKATVPIDYWPFAGTRFILKDGTIMALYLSPERHWGLITVTKTGVFSSTPIEQGSEYGVGRRNSVKVGDKTYYALLGRHMPGTNLVAVSESSDFQLLNTRRADSEVNFKIEGDVVECKTVQIPSDDPEGKKIFDLLTKTQGVGEVVVWDAKK